MRARYALSVRWLFSGFKCSLNNKKQRRQYSNMQIRCLYSCFSFLFLFFWKYYITDNDLQSKYFCCVCLSFARYFQTPWENHLSTVMTSQACHMFRSPLEIGPSPSLQNRCVFYHLESLRHFIFISKSNKQVPVSCQNSINYSFEYFRFLSVYFQNWRRPFYHMY